MARGGGRCVVLGIYEAARGEAFQRVAIQRAQREALYIYRRVLVFAVGVFTFVTLVTPLLVPLVQVLLLLMFVVGAFDQRSGEILGHRLLVPVAGSRGLPLLHVVHVARFLDHVVQADYRAPWYLPAYLFLQHPVNHVDLHVVRMRVGKLGEEGAFLFDKLVRRLVRLLLRGEHVGVYLVGGFLGGERVLEHGHCIRPFRHISTDGLPPLGRFPLEQERQLVEGHVLVHPFHVLVEADSNQKLVQVFSVSIEPSRALFKTALLLRRLRSRGRSAHPRVVLAFVHIHLLLFPFFFLFGETRDRVTYIGSQISIFDWRSASVETSRCIIRRDWESQEFSKWTCSCAENCQITVLPGQRETALNTFFRTFLRPIRA